MKITFRIAILILFFKTQSFVSQNQGEYVVSLTNDTLPLVIEYMDDPCTKIMVKENGKEKFIYSDSVLAVYFISSLYESVFYNQKWMFMQKILSGDLILYSTEEDLDKISDGYYIRQKNEARGLIHPITEEKFQKKLNALKLPYSCKAVMDSLLQKSDWTSFFIDTIKLYNTNCSLKE